MASEWSRRAMSQVCTLIVDCVNKTAPLVEGPTPYRMIRVTNFKDGRLDFSECRYVDESTFKIWTRRAVPQRGDVLLTREAPLGQVALIRDENNVFLGQRVMQFRANPELLDSNFLYYSFLAKDLQSQIHSHSGTGSTVDHIRVPDCSKFRISFPPLHEQEKTVYLLSCIDLRIDTLRSANRNLEAIAQAIFRSWFVDFGPVRANAEGREPEGMDAATADLFPREFAVSQIGQIPFGWSWSSLTQFMDINPLRSLSKLAPAPYLEMANAPTNGSRPAGWVMRMPISGCRFRNGDTLLAKITPCLENGKTAFVDFLEDDEVGWGSTEFVVLSPKAPIPPSFGYLLARYNDFRAFAIQSMSGTSGRQRVQVDQLGKFEFAIADAAVYGAFARIVEPMFKSIRHNDEMAKTLAELRDTLLPCVISGKLRVPEAEKLAEAAL